MCKIMGVISIACFVVGAPAWAAGDPKIGTAAVASNDVNGTLGRERRALKRGDGVFQNETIATGRDARAQLLFNDETALTMGPDSRVTLDTLVYDPNKKSGQMTIRAVAGAFRFVTGSAPKEGYKIETPVGTIGVRGTIVQFAIRDSRLSLQLDEGGAYFCNRGGRCAELTRPGTYLVVSGPQVGAVQSKFIKPCDAGGGSARCYVANGDDNLFIQFLGRRDFPHEAKPAMAPPPPPPVPPPPVKTLPPTTPPPVTPIKTLPPAPPPAPTTIVKSLPR